MARGSFYKLNKQVQDITHLQPTVQVRFFYFILKCKYENTEYFNVVRHFAWRRNG